MRILEITRSYYPSVGGLEKFVRDRLRIYDAIGIDYKLITTNFTTEKKDYGVEIPEIVYLNQYSPYQFTPGLKRILTEEQYDILSVNQIGRYLSDFAISYAKKLNKKIILTPHLYYHTDKYSFLKLLHQKFMVSHLLDSVDRIICFTEYERKFWAENYKLAENKACVIPHYFSPGVENDSEEESSGQRYILYLGRNDKNKRIDLLIDAFSQMKDVDLSLFITAGYETLTPEQKVKVDEDKRIRLLGYVSEEEKHALLKSAAALILPTDYEAFGIVLLEASHFSKPILCSKLELFSEILCSEGIMYFENNKESIKNTIRDFSLLDNKKLKMMGESNKRNLRKFTFEKIFAEYKSTIHELCK